MARRMRSDWGSVTEMERGRRYRLRWWASTPEGYRRCSRVVRGTRREAMDELARIRLAHSSDAPAPTCGTVFREHLVPRWEHEMAEGERSDATMAVYQSTWRLHIAPTWASVPVDQVRPLLVQQWLSALPRNAAVRSLNIMRALMDVAVRYEWAPTNTCRERYVLPSKSTSTTRAKGVWPLAELGGLWRKVRGEWFEGAFLVAAFGGLRPGEALGVMGADVRGDAIAGVPVALVDVRRQVRTDDALTERLKTPQSARTAVVVGLAAMRLCELSEGAEWLTENGAGGHSTQKALRLAWQEVAPWSFRNLRNSWETWMRHEMRVPPYVIEPLMGHKSPGVTGTYYDRPLAQSLAQTVAECYAARPYDRGWGVDG